MPGRNSYPSLIYIMNKPLKIVSLVFCLITLPFLIFNGKIQAQEQGKFAVIGYSMDKTDEVDKFPVEKLTHLIYSFLHLKGNVLNVKDHDSLAISHLVSLKKRNPQLKIILSLGGWSGCRTCPDVFSTAAGRLEFAQSVKQTLEKYKADGLDLDWEYPAIASAPGFPYYPADRHNFTLLMQILRKTLGKHYELSFAAGGFSEFLVKSIEWKEVMPVLNYVNLMTYDLTNGYSTVTGHHTPLYSTPRQPGSVDFAVKFLDSLGVPRDKMIIGAAFYARVFKNVPDIDHGLYQPCSFTAYVNFRDFGTYFSESSGFISYWDSTAQAPYCYNAEKHLFATFDNKQSVELKTRYAISNKLGGIMFWSLTGDLYENGLLDVIDRTRKEKRSSNE